ncbi:MAG: hypothetical protein J6F30_12045 [Cellulosilyticum sp.]|nr:hypothetical protein [Cellulosilyticum sp.]
MLIILNPNLFNILKQNPKIHITRSRNYTGYFKGEKSISENYPVFKDTYFEITTRARKILVFNVKFCDRTFKVFSRKYNTENVVDAVCGTTLRSHAVIYQNNKLYFGNNHIEIIKEYGLETSNNLTILGSYLATPIILILEGDNTGIIYSDLPTPLFVIEHISNSSTENDYKEYFNSKGITIMSESEFKQL